MATCSTEEQYLSALQSRARLPQGFSTATASLEFISIERRQSLSMNLALILLDEPTARFAGVFTSNRFCGAPVLIGRRRLEEQEIRAVLINNRIANVGAPGAEQDAEELCEALGGVIGEPGRRIMPASTGIIGWKLPVQDMKESLAGLTAGLRRDSGLPLARAIMTTDSYPKIHREEAGGGSIVGIAKGAGMIEPDMGTMLAFILTDLSMDRRQLRRCLGRSVDRSFNRISVDGDQSTSDMALLLASARGPGVPEQRFQEALDRVCSRLAADVVRNGEGVGHVIRVLVQGAPEQRLAVGAGKAVVNSPLVKTAVFGNDPNVGRIVSALGDFASAAGMPLDLERLRVSLGGVDIFSNGNFRLDAGKESRLSGYLRECALDPEARGFPAHDREVVLDIDLGAGSEAAQVLGSDLSYRYVKENANYRS